MHPPYRLISFLDLSLVVPFLHRSPSGTSPSSGQLIDLSLLGPVSLASPPAVSCKVSDGTQRGSESQLPNSGLPQDSLHFKGGHLIGNLRYLGSIMAVFRGLRR